MQSDNNPSKNWASKIQAALSSWMSKTKQQKDQAEPGASGGRMGFVGLVAMVYKIKIMAILTAILVLGIIVYKTGLFGSITGTWQKPAHTLVMSQLLEMKEINKLYSGTYMVPVLDVYREILKRDKLLSIVGSEAKPVPRGYCLKKYEVGFGYDNILDLLQDETFMDAVCSGPPSALPAPKILAINCISTDPKGDYRGDLMELDLAENEQRRRARIYMELAGGSLDKINELSQKSLHSLASLFCR